MGPLKRTRQNTQAPTDQPAEQQKKADTAQEQVQGQEATLASTSLSKQLDSTAKDAPNTPSASHGKAAARSSWYGGSWRSKASPLTETARESISVAQGVTTEALAESGRQIAEASKRPGQYVSKSMRGSRKSIPLVAEPTRVHATSDASGKSRSSVGSQEKLKGLDVDGNTEPEREREREPEAAPEEPAPLPPVPTAEVTEDSKSVESTLRPQSGSWFGWWSRPDGYGSESEKAREDNKKRKLEEASSTPLPSTPNEDAGTDTAPILGGQADSAPQEAPVSQDATSQGTQGLQPEMSANLGSGRSWFRLWSSAQNEQTAANEEPPKEPSQTQESQPAVNVATQPTDAQQDTRAATDPNNLSVKDAEDRPKSAGWAFWSTDKPRDAAPTPGGTQKQVGELAVADTPSQSHPEAAQFNEQQEAEQAKALPKRTGSLLKTKRNRDQKTDATQSPAASGSATPVEATVAAPSKEESEAPKPVQRGKLPQTRPNAILPSFLETYPVDPNPGYLERLTQYVAQTLRILPGSQTGQPPLHVYKTLQPPKVKRAIAIGVHGFFPAPLIQKVLGPPTGTSIRFANYAATSIKAWCQENQPDVQDVEIEKVALEGEGFIADRVSTLWKLMLNWLSHLRQADFVFVACHSQGVPVAIMLVAKLIQLGCLSPNVRIGVGAMAGINLGPFLEYKSRFFGDVALQLFEFSNHNSQVSKHYAESLDICLRHGVRVTYVGSLDDQLVSLESSLFAPLSHPYVNRATFIDGRLHAPDFLSHLLTFALKLRNRGVSDHGLIRELSAPLAGSLVGGQGHSRVYDDPAVYRLAVDFALQSTDAQPLPQVITALESEADFARRSSSGYPTSTAEANKMRRGSVGASSLPGIGAVITPYEPPANNTNPNPFVLPWAVRGLLEEELVKREMMDEVRELVREFEDWKPITKQLKDVRWRLEGVRSMI